MFLCLLFSCSGVHWQTHETLMIVVKTRYYDIWLVLKDISRSTLSKEFRIGRKRSLTNESFICSRIQITLPTHE